MAVVTVKCFGVAAVDQGGLILISCIAVVGLSIHYLKRLFLNMYVGQCSYSIAGSLLPPGLTGPFW